MLLILAVAMALAILVTTGEAASANYPQNEYAYQAAALQSSKSFSWLSIYCHSNHNYLFFTGTVCVPPGLACDTGNDCCPGLYCLIKSIGTLGACLPHP